MKRNSLIVVRADVLPDAVRQPSLHFPDSAEVSETNNISEAFYMRPDMKLMPARLFISGAGLRHCCVYMMLGRTEIFISGPHENFMSRFHAGMKISCKHIFLRSLRYENQISFVFLPSNRSTPCLT